MSTSYPGIIDSFTTKQDGIDIVVASHVNNLQDSVVAVENELGTNPKGSYTSVGAGLADKVSKAGDTLSGQLIVAGDGLGTSVADGGTAVGFKLNTPSYTTGGAKLLSLQNNSTEKLFIDKDGKLDTNSDLIRMRTSKTPSSASYTGNAGEICWDSDYIYVCVATDTWKRAAISTWP